MSPESWHYEVRLKADATPQDSETFE
jgi:hypothetical protein